VCRTCLEKRKFFEATKNCEQSEGGFFFRAFRDVSKILRSGKLVALANRNEWLSRLLKYS
jgi:hypothetical protein